MASKYGDALWKLNLSISDCSSCKQFSIAEFSWEVIKIKALLAIMVVDIQLEYRFYSEKEEIRLQKNMDIRRKYVGIARRVRSTQNRPAAASDLRG